MENKEDILLCNSFEYFHNFNNILYDKNIDIEQDENILKIKFNTTTNNAKLEYYIVLVDYEKDLDLLSYHDIIFGNNFIYKNVIYSIGIEPIETIISLNDNLVNNKNYIIIVLGKDIYGESYNYIYHEPKKIFINKTNDEINEKEEKKK